MSWSAAEDAIAARFAAQSTLGTIDWSAFNLPEASKPVPNAADPIWGRLSVKGVPNSGRPLGMGTAAPTRRDGLIYAQLFAPLGKGEAALSSKVDETLSIFHRVVFSGVYCHDADPPNRVGVDVTGAWHQVNCVFPYHVEEFRADVPGTYLDAVRTDFTQSGHSLVAGDAVRRSAGSWVKAIASAENTLADAVIVAVNGDRLTVSRQGFQSWTHGLGSSGKVYLSQGTSGALTTTKPTSGWAQEIGTVVSSSQVLLHMDAGVLL